MLSARGLRKRYKSREVVHDFGLDLDAGEVVGLLGPNGAGKTTCFYMIVGLVPTDAGQIALDGEDITALPMHERARRGIGYLPQEASVFRKLSVSDNLMAVLELRSDLNATSRRRELDSLLDHPGTLRHRCKGVVDLSLHCFDQSTDLTRRRRGPLGKVANLSSDNGEPFAVLSGSSSPKQRW